eukprot:TRINITY_DN8010_c0_g1_i3.p1 TRINITY_DN8010_c0_g1~~TRINITY_DN8010_c0_g1_i3.p1  ORF type:complete len:636 (+),score=179.29 TRINITY_DN8010_c0_g1_i3:460-2367(+)
MATAMPPPVEEDAGPALDQDILRRKRLFEMQMRGSEDPSMYNLPTEFARKKKKRTNNELTEELKEEDPKAAGLQEDYGKGFEIMRKIGFKVGSGLGKDEQGLKEPVKAVKKTAFSRLVDPYATTYTKDEINPADDNLNPALTKRRGRIGDEEDLEADEERRENRALVHRWKRERNTAKGPGKPRKVKFSDRDALELGEQLLEEAKPEPIALKVVDFTKGEARVYDSYDAIASLTKNARRTAPIPEERPKFLNDFALFLKRAFEQTRHSVVALERKAKSTEDEQVTLNYEKGQLEEEVKENRAFISGLKSIKEKLTSIRQAVREKKDVDLTQEFLQLAQSYPKEFQEYNLATIFTALYVRQNSPYFASWEPAKDPKFASEKMKDLVEFYKVALPPEEKETFIERPKHAFLSFQAKKGKLDGGEKHLIFVYQELWFPAVKRFLANEFEPKTNFEAAITLLEAWAKVVPSEIIESVIEQSVMPRLRKAVEEWEPTQDRTPIHTWIHPWLPLIKSTRLVALWKPIQMKLSKALQRWQPTDRSAFVLLTPWRRVLDDSEWYLLMNRCILPKVMYHLQTFEVNPRNQNIDLIKNILEWEDYLPFEQIVNLYETQLLQKFGAILNEWLENCLLYTSPSPRDS